MLRHAMFSTEKTCTRELTTALAAESPSPMADNDAGERQAQPSRCSLMSTGCCSGCSRASVPPDSRKCFIRKANRSSSGQSTENKAEFKDTRNDGATAAPHQLSRGIPNLPKMNTQLKKRFSTKEIAAPINEIRTFPTLRSRYVEVDAMPRAGTSYR